MFVRLLPVALAFVVLAAHVSRAGFPALAVVSLSLTGLLAVRRPWAARTMQALLLAGAAEWIRALLGYVAIRKAAGAPWIRLVFILGAVSLLTAAAALVFRSPSVRRRFGLDSRDS